MKTLKEKLIELRICPPGVEWAGDKTIEEIWATCPRGDWMLCLFEKTNPEDIKLLFLAKGHCANTVRHLMKDARSIVAVDAAIAFGNGEITKEELDKAAKDAWDAAETAQAATNKIASYTSANYPSINCAAANAGASCCSNHTPPHWGAESAATAASYAAFSSIDSDSASAKIANQLLTADICRKYLPVPTI